MNLIIRCILRASAGFGRVWTLLARLDRKGRWSTWPMLRSIPGGSQAPPPIMINFAGRVRFQRINRTNCPVRIDRTGICFEEGQKMFVMLPCQPSPQVATQTPKITYNFPLEIPDIQKKQRKKKRSGINRMLLMK